MVTTLPSSIGAATVPPTPMTIGGVAVTIAPDIIASLRAYRAALPALLATKSEDRQWVAFGGDECITFGKTKTAVVQECLARGWKRGKFIVRSIEPELPEEVELPNDL